MYTALDEFARRPEPFCVYTAARLWNDPHIAQEMLRAHLDRTADRASRNAEAIDRSVDWIDRSLTLRDKRICDLGCGPGLYTSQFCDRGAEVLGMDLSSSSIEYANREAVLSARDITYVMADYTEQDLPTQCDIFTLIYCDYCALSPQQRKSLLKKIRTSLGSVGALVLDVFSETALHSFNEETLIALHLMNGFWSKSDYVGLKKSFRYASEKISLDRYLIIEAHQNWEVFNWLQYFSLPRLNSELQSAGFVIDKVAASLTGESYNEKDELIAVIARTA